MNIGRTLFWFSNGEERLSELNNQFFGLGTLLNRLLNEYYAGKKIKFINLNFSTEETYKTHPILPRESSYYYGGHLTYYGTIDLAEFNLLSSADQAIYIWERAHKWLNVCGDEMKNEGLKTACEYAYQRGLEIKLNTDFKVVDKTIIVYGRNIKATLWIRFLINGIYSVLSLEKDGNIFFEKEINKTNNGVEFFLEMYKDVIFKDKSVIVIGRKDVKDLPLKIPLDEKLIST